MYSTPSVEARLSLRKLARWDLPVCFGPTTNTFALSPAVVDMVAECVVVVVVWVLEVGNGWISVLFVCKLQVQTATTGTW